MKKPFLLTVSLLLIGSASHADEIYRISRYTALNPVATSEQSDILSAVVTLDFPERITTVGGAIRHLLHRSGYRLAGLDASDPTMPMLLDLPLPSVHRNLGPIRIDLALRSLAGPAWDLVVDPVHRLVSFDLIEPYTKSSFDPLSSKAATL